ncbi:MAG: hypothetical protein ACYC7H_12455, partial [Chloroflexota bacterium]
MRRERLAVAATVVLVALALGFPAVVAAAATLTLNPTSGNAPSVSGSLAGAGWLCDGGAAPLGGASVTGAGVTGSATVNRDGSLSGDFTVRGTAGQRVEVKATASTSCPTIGPPIYLQATAFFTFNAPPPTATTQPTPTRAPTATSQPSNTPLPTATTQPTFTSQPTATTAPTDTQRPTAAATATPEPEPSYTPTATFAGTAYPTMGRTPLATSTATPEVGPTATAPKAAPTQLAGVVNGQGSLVFLGCLPSPWQVSVEFLPVGLLSVGGTQSSTPSGPTVRVATTPVPGAPGKLTFQPPSTTEAGRVYKVSAIVDDPQCALDPKSTSQYWLAGAGKDVRVAPVISGETRLEASSNGDKVPTPKPEVKGAFVEFGRPAYYSEVIPPNPFDGWETQLEFWGSVEGRWQRFRWSTDLKAPASAVLQAGFFPFAKGYEKDPLSPPGLLASWPVDCVDCEFVVELSPLPVVAPKAPAPPTAAQNDSWLDKLGQLISAPFQAVGSFFGNLAQAVAGLFGGSQEPATQPSVKAVPYVVSPDVKVAPGAVSPSLKYKYETQEIVVPAAKVIFGSSNLATNGAAIPIYPTFNTFYFRVLPLKDGNPVGGSSNSVIMHWGGQEPPAPLNIKITPPTPTPTPTVSPYKVQIVSYHGTIAPLKYCTYGDGYESYVVTQDTWWDTSKSLLYFTTEPIAGSPPYFKKGDVLCEPAPEEPSLLDKIGGWVSGAWNWVSEAYSDLKNTVVSAVGVLIPDTLCSDSCVGTLLDAALVSMGIPPDIPNLDQLMNEGLDYLAQQTLSQIGLPPEVLNQTGPYAGMLLSEAEAKFKEEAQAKLKEGLRQGVQQIQLGYADSVGWLYKGVPVRPNEHQPPGMVMRVTRKWGVPGGEAGCTANVYDTLTIDQSKLGNVPPGYANSYKEINGLQAFVAGKYYDPFADLKVPVPALLPGTSVDIPVVFRPNVYNSGWNPTGGIPTVDFMYAWGFLEMMGDVHLSVYGCGSTNLDVA